jgi:hypothetical protein
MEMEPDSSHTELWNQFGEFVEKFNKEYESEEEYGRRYGIFRDNMRKVKLLQDNEQGTATYGNLFF